jgi:hypothetical protein
MAVFEVTGDCFVEHDERGIAAYLHSVGGEQVTSCSIDQKR